ncbi:MAG: substrate-binding domain-containing protein, partial [Verrucomicrobia bacterium]|nr:substrate-binding domain-containing protein [Verrucomicrobiota bacterium]
MKLAIILKFAPVICLLSALANTSHAEDKPIKQGLKIAFVPKNINNPYNVIETGGSIAACKEMGADGKVVSPSDPSASSQVSYINTLITQRENAIVLAANDPNALIPYLKRAMDQKITVVTMDSDTVPQGRTIFVNQATSEMSVKHGPVTLLSVVDDRSGRPKLLVAEGESLAGPTLAIGNTNSRYWFSIGARHFIDNWNANGPAHHCAIGVGHISRQLKKFAALLRI